MNLSHDHQFSPPVLIDPLPEEFSPTQRVIDRRLGEVAHQSPVPLGLSGRVFEASARLLTSERSDQPSRLRFPSVSPGRVVQRLAWGRLAMAAAVALACTVAVWYLQRPAPDRPMTVAIAMETPGLADFDQLADDSTGEAERKLSYLWATNELTSPDDISNELVMLVSKMGM